MFNVPKPLVPRPLKFNPAVQKVRFNFQYMRLKGAYSCHKLDDRQERQIVSKLNEYKRFTVAQFSQSSSVRLKTIHKRDFPKPPQELSEEIKDLLGQEFRISLKCRVFGYLHIGCFYVMMIDPDHRYC